MFAPLAKGETVGIVAPASPVKADRLEGAIGWLEGLGFRVRVGTSVGPADRFLAGDDAARAADLVAMFEDADIKAVFAARGGYGSSRALPFVEWDVLRANPKPFFGFSDTTAFQLGALANAGLASFTGFVLTYDVVDGAPHAAVASDVNVVMAGSLPQPADGLVHDGDLEGTIVGGCLSLVAHLAGTPYLPETAGSLLVLEDVDESPYRIDRMLTQLLLSGCLDGAAGVLVGTFEDCTGDAEDGTVEQVIEDFAGRCPCPVVRGLPYGHGRDRRLIPIGARGRVSDGKLSYEVT